MKAALNGKEEKKKKSDGLPKLVQALVFDGSRGNNFYTCTRGRSSGCPPGRTFNLGVEMPLFLFQSQDISLCHALFDEVSNVA